MRLAGFHPVLALHGSAALEILDETVDLILLDAEMPLTNGFEFAEQVRGDPRHHHVPILMISGSSENGARQRAFASGVNDFIVKPVDAEELGLRARWLVDLKRSYDRLMEHGQQLKEAALVRNRRLTAAQAEMRAARNHTEAAHLETISRLTIAAEAKDSETALHIQRIGAFAEILANGLGLDAGFTRMIGRAAPMHDIGKIGVPDHILLKPGPLNADEWQIMRTHAEMGGQILANSPSPVIEMAERIARNHHERWDGLGYPSGQKCEDIPLEARICTVVDVFDALTVERPYRRALSSGMALAMMKEEPGTHFDPMVLDGFLQVLVRILEVGENLHG